MQTGDTVSGLVGVPVTDHVEEVHRCELEFVTALSPVGAGRCVIRWDLEFK